MLFLFGYVAAFVLSLGSIVFSCGHMILDAYNGVAFNRDTWRYAGLWIISCLAFYYMAFTGPVLIS